MSGARESKREAARRPGEADAALRLEPGLYLVATPIGNAADITLRALDVLNRADAIMAEDTRETRKLMQIHGIALGGRPMISYHDRNAGKVRPRIEEWLAAGMAVAYCTDAGTPLVADPGYRLTELAIAGEYRLTALPGASAVLTALSLSGLPTDRFLFEGFLPTKPVARQKALHALRDIPATLVFYESPKRIAATLHDMAETLGSTRQAAIARELTKKFEDVRRDRLDALAAVFESSDPPRGEIVIVVGPPDPAQKRHASEGALDEMLRAALARLSVKDAVHETAKELGLPRREVYARALELARK